MEWHRSRTFGAWRERKLADQHQRPTRSAAMVAVALSPTAKCAVSFKDILERNSAVSWDPDHPSIFAARSGRLVVGVAGVVPRQELEDPEPVGVRVSIVTPLGLQADRPIAVPVIGTNSRLLKVVQVDPR